MKEKNSNFSISYPNKGKLPRLPFRKIKESMLGKKYELSLVRANNSLSKKLNRIYRKKNKPTDVLSFNISKNSGEIFLNPEIAAKKAKDFKTSAKKHTLYLFIHGILHLKGFVHGSKMKQEEQRWKKKFNLD